MLKCYLECENSSYVLFVLYLMASGGKIGTTNSFARDSHPTVKTVSPTPSWENLQSLRDASQFKMIDIAKQSIDVARAYILVYDNQREELYRKYGSALVTDPSAPIAPSGTSRVLSMSLVRISYKLIASAEYEEKFGYLTIQDQESFLELFASDVIKGNVIAAIQEFNIPTHSEYVRRDFDQAVENLWHLMRRRRKLEKNEKEVAGDIIVSIIWQAKQLPRRAQRGEKSGFTKRPYDQIAPGHVWFELIEKFSRPSNREFLANWLDEWGPLLRS